MWTIYNKTLDKYWNTDKEDWVDVEYATGYNTYGKAKKELKNTKSVLNTFITIKLLQKNI